jgi:hypothetical protein
MSRRPSWTVRSSWALVRVVGHSCARRHSSSGCRRRRSRGTRLRRLGAPVSHLILRAGAGGCVVCGEAGSSAGGLAASAGPVGAGTPARLDVSLCYIRCAWQRVTPACHTRPGTPRTAGAPCLALARRTGLVGHCGGAPAPHRGSGRGEAQAQGGGEAARRRARLRSLLYGEERRDLGHGGGYAAERCSPRCEVEFF